MPKLPSDLKPEYVCEYCGKRYVRELAFLAHTCEPKTRIEHSKTPRGMLAYQLYVHWLSKSHRARKVSMQTFLSSSSYPAFIRFVDWGMRVKLPGFERYINFMVDKQYTPPMWCLTEVYSQFLEFLDFKLTVEDHLEITIKTLVKVSRDMDVHINQVLMELHPGSIIEQVLNRNLSPWVLLKSTAFKLRWKTFNQDVKDQLTKAIRPDFWQAKMAMNVKDTEYIQQIVSRLGL